MAKRRHSMRRKMRGGYSSAATYELATVGDMNQQYNNAIGIRGGENLVASNSTQVVPLNNPNANGMQGVPTSGQLALIQSAGARRRRRSHRRKSAKMVKKGGSLLGGILTVGALLGLNKLYGKTIRRRSLSRHRSSRRR